MQVEIFWEVGVMRYARNEAVHKACMITVAYMASPLIVSGLIAILSFAASASLGDEIRTIVLSNIYSNCWI